MTPTAELFQESFNPIPTINSIEANTRKDQSSHTINFNNTLHNQLFFIQYTPDIKRQRNKIDTTNKNQEMETCTTFFRKGRHSYRE